MTQKILFAISMGKTRYLRHLKYQHLWINNKVGSDKKCNLFAFFISAESCRKLDFLISQGSVATFWRWDGYCRMVFVINFIRFSSVQTFWKSVNIWQSYREFKGGNFFETQCIVAAEDQLISSHHGPRIKYAVLIISSAHEDLRWWN